MPSRYTTDTINPVVPAGFEPAIFPMSRGCPNPLNDGTNSATTRIRTRNPKLEAWDDSPFHHRGQAEGNEPSSPVLENSLSRAARPTVSGYLPKRTHRESNPDLRHLWHRPPADAPDAFPLDHEPHLQWTAGELNPDSLGANQVSSLWTSSPFFLRGPPGT